MTGRGSCCIPSFAVIPSKASLLILLWVAAEPIGTLARLTMELASVHVLGQPLPEQLLHAAMAARPWPTAMCDAACGRRSAAPTQKLHSLQLCRVHGQLGVQLSSPACCSSLFTLKSTMLSSAKFVPPGRMSQPPPECCNAVLLKTALQAGPVVS